MPSIHLADSAFTGTDDAATVTPIDVGFDFEWGASGIKRFVFPTTDATLIFANAGHDPPTVNYGDTLDSLLDDPTALFGVAVTAADHVLASDANGYSYPGYTGINYTRVGTSPDRVFAITFDLPFYSGSESNGEHVRAQIQLHEDGTIEAHYQTFAIDPGDAISSLTIGIWWRDSTATDRTLLGEIDGNTYNVAWPASPIPDEQAVRYVSAGDDWSQEPCDFNWIDTDVSVETSEGLEWHVTGLWHPDATTVAYFGRIADPTEGEVTIPLNDSRLASVTLSKYDPLVEAVQGHAYARCLKVYYHKQLVFWGPIKLIEYGLDGQDPSAVKLSAVDPSLRLVRQVLVRGDDALNGAHGDTGTISVDHLGLRTLRDAGLNTAEQTAENDPDLGIIDGSNDYAESALVIGVQRGQQVWAAFLALSQALGPDFDLQPIEDTTGAYCRLNTYTRKGSDVSAVVSFHYGTGKQNLDGLSFTEGGDEYTTHVHVLDSIPKYRFTEVNLDAAADTGPYVTWDATEFDARDLTHDEAEDVLRAYGQDFLKAYGRPLVTCQITLPVETVDSYVYGVDYAEGDTVGVAGRDGFIEMEEAAYRITQVVLRQENIDNAVRPVIVTVPDRVTAAGDIVGSGGAGS